MPPTADDQTPTTTAFALSDEPRIPHLVVLNGPDVGRVYRLTPGDSIIGRDQTTQICLSQESVSRRHALVVVSDDQVSIEDLGSTNGTFVGIDRIKARTVIPDGTNIGLGLFTLLRLTFSPGTTETLRRLHAGHPSLSTSRKVNTRNYLLDLLQCEHAYARRHQTPLTLIFVRADAISAIGAKAGATIRDDAMGVVGTEIDSAIRTEDFMARAGHDEFAILIRSDGKAAESLAERLRSRIESRAARPGSALAFHTITAVVLPIRAVSLSIVSRSHHDSVTAEDILSTARALAGPAMHISCNTVVRLQTLAI